MSLKERVRSLVGHLFDQPFDNDAVDLYRELRRRALMTSAEYAEANMVGIPILDDRYRLIDHALQAVQKGGLYMEFGVYKGDSLNHIAKRVSGLDGGALIFGFDSFQGLPQDWWSNLPEGSFRVDELPSVESNVRLVKGWFDETLPKFVEDRVGQKASFVHVDCDLYSSARTVLSLLRKLDLNGAVLVFDEYFNYPGWQNHEFKAFQEYVKECRVKYKYLGYCRRSEQVAVQITEVTADAASAHNETQ